ncbi:TetR/AcrR family transcriptional regulator (plasmid) [Rhodococcus erythropolis]|uniref:TetR/AcrR family transcriptional regulator n=1 Tax=Rhodococcus erythropolis TaxID=1833 RepID=UPI00406BB154
MMPASEWRETRRDSQPHDRGLSINYDYFVTNPREPNGHQIRSERSTRLLLHAAGDLVAEGGYQTMTLATVGERAGYSRSLATARFGSKAKLLEALVDEIEGRWSSEVILPETELPGLEALQAYVARIRDAYAQDPWSLTVMYALIFEALRPVPDLRERFVNFHRDLQIRIASIIRNGIEDGSIDPATDPEQQATVITAQLRGVGYLWRLDPDSIDPDAVLTLFIEQLTRQLDNVTSRVFD